MVGTTYGEKEFKMGLRLQLALQLVDEIVGGVDNKYLLISNDIIIIIK